MYDRAIEGRELTFGVSRRLYQSNVLLYDRETESLWSQLKEEAVTGRMTGTRLQPLPSVMTTWGRWKKLHPKTMVLSPDTGYSRPYDRNPYEGYERSPDIMFPPSLVDRRLRPKERVLGLEVGGDELAVAFRSLAGRDLPLRLRLGGAPVEIRYDAATETAEVFVGGEPAPAFTGYWFAWYGFHPQTKVWGERDPTPSAPGRDPSVTIVAHEGGWGDLTGVGPGGELADAGSFYLISGTLRNDSNRPIGYVKISYELVNDSGEVVFREYGYNRKAEDLRDDAFEKGQKSPREMGVESIAASGGTDSFRMLLFRDELPPFSRYRVLVGEVGEPSRRVTAGSRGDGGGQR